MTTQNGFLHHLERMFLVVTNRCNARCRLCRYWACTPEHSLTPSQIEANVVPMIEKYGIRLTLITGGEPTLHPDLPEILNILKATGTVVSLITNGSHFSAVYDDIADSIDAVMFSIDAGNERLYREIRGLDNLPDTMEWPKKIKQHRPFTQVAFNCVVQKKNAGHLAELYRQAAELPLDAIFFNAPELKPLCFGDREDKLPELRENALLDDHEIKALQDDFKKIVELDARRGIVFQGHDFFDRLLQYFRLMREDVDESSQTGQNCLNDPRSVCRVPYNSIVYDESSQLLPCFYLPFSIHSPSKDRDPVNIPSLVHFRNEFSTDIKYRRKHCSFCLQYQG